MPCSLPHAAAGPPPPPRPPPPAQVEVHRLVWFVGILSFTVAIILFAIGLGRKMNPLSAFVNGFILVVVANVPEVRAPCRVMHGDALATRARLGVRLLPLVNAAPLFIGCPPHAPQTAQPP